MYRILICQSNEFIYTEFNDSLKLDDFVVIENENEIQLGKVIEICDKKIDSSYHVLRLATKEDLNSFERNLKDASEAYKKCKEIVIELGLDMRIVASKFSLDRKQLLFNFVADERIDFRELARRLASIYHTRIELHQIGIRDKAKEVGGVGICGNCLCCTNFLNKIEGISMNMAKNQNLALNPSKINGVCGRLLCCLAYEDENYIKCAKGIPNVGDEIKTPDGKANVVSVNILNRSYKVIFDGELKEYFVDDNSKK